MCTRCPPASSPSYPVYSRHFSSASIFQDRCHVCRNSAHGEELQHFYRPPTFGLLAAMVAAPYLWQPDATFPALPTPACESLQVHKELRRDLDETIATQRFLDGLLRLAPLSRFRVTIARAVVQRLSLIDIVWGYFLHVPEVSWLWR